MFASYFTERTGRSSKENRRQALCHVADQPEEVGSTLAFKHSEALKTAYEELATRNKRALAQATAKAAFDCHTPGGAANISISIMDIPFDCPRCGQNLISRCQARNDTKIRTHLTRPAAHVGRTKRAYKANLNRAEDSSPAWVLRLSRISHNDGESNKRKKGKKHSPTDTGI